jgi:hypothetical protein
MAQVLDEAERQGRRRRLVIILVVAGVLVGALMTFGIVRDRSIDDATDAAIADLQAKWRPLNLTVLEADYRESSFTCVSTGDCPVWARMFPTASHATFSNVRFNQDGTVQANYYAHAFASNQCLSLLAAGPAPNEVTVTRGGIGCSTSN